MTAVDCGIVAEIADVICAIVTVNQSIVAAAIVNVIVTNARVDSRIVAIVLDIVFAVAAVNLRIVAAVDYGVVAFAAQERGIIGRGVDNFLVIFVVRNFR